MSLKVPPGPVNETTAPDEAAPLAFVTLTATKPSEELMVFLLGVSTVLDVTGEMLPMLGHVTVTVTPRLG